MGNEPGEKTEQWPFPPPGRWSDRIGCVASIPRALVSRVSLTPKRSKETGKKTSAGQGVGVMLVRLA